MATWPGDQLDSLPIGPICCRKCCPGSKGVIRRCFDFMFATDERIIECLPEYNIWNIQRLYSKYNGEEYGTYIVTFGMPKPPEFMKVVDEIYRIEPLRPRINELAENKNDENPTESEQTEPNKDEIRGNSQKRRNKKRKRINAVWEIRKDKSENKDLREVLKITLKRGPANVRDKPPESISRKQQP
jgi:hypothetical protein